MISQEEFSKVCSTLGVQVTENGLCVPQGASEEDYVEIIRALIRLESSQSCWTKFAMGQMVMDIPNVQHGERKAFCIERFGEQLGQSVMQYYWVAKSWEWNRKVGWPWSFYRATARCNREMQESFIKRWKAKGQKLTVRIITDELRVKNSTVEFLTAPDKPEYTTGSERYVESRCNALAFAGECQEQDAIDMLSILLSRFPGSEEEE